MMGTYGSRLSLTLFFGLTASLAAAQAEPVEKRCCFTNPRYSGVCVVERAEDETCDSILTYLNDPMSSGKTYCQSTTIRGGWEQVKCPPEEGEASRAAAATPCPEAGSGRPERTAKRARERIAVAQRSGPS